MNWDTKKDRFYRALVKEVLGAKSRQVNYLKVAKQQNLDAFETDIVIELLEGENYLRILDKEAGECKFTAKGVSAGS